MVTNAGGATMAKNGAGGPRKRGPAPRPEGPGTQVRVDSDIAYKLRVLAAANSETVSTYLSHMIRRPVDERWRRYVSELERGEGGPPKGPGGKK